MLELDAAAVAFTINADPTLPVTATAEQVAVALAEVDTDATVQQWRDLLTVEVWDELSAINGVPVEVLRESHPELFATAEVGDVVLIKDPFGTVLQLQWHMPGIEGIVPVPKGEGTNAQHGEAWAIDQATRPAAVQMVLHAREAVRVAAVTAGDLAPCEPTADPWPDLPVVLVG